ncbi:MAG: four helix bundle protein [Bacteroidia bacterium]|jgi:four helix bundle protein
MESPHKQLLIFKKAMEIAEITHALIESIEEEDDKFHIREQMLANAYVLGAKIAGAEGAGIYRIRMENAVLIKLAACELQAQTSLCRAENLSENDYIQLLRDEIENFRKLFVSWVDSFDSSDNYDDGWGIF